MKHNRNRPSRRPIWAFALPSRPDRAEQYGPPLLLSQDEVAHRLGVSRTTIWRLIRDGELEVVAIGARSAIVNASLEGFIARNTTRRQKDEGA